VVEPPKIRDDGFHGGRCEVHIMNRETDMTLRVKDAVSLYLTIMYYDRYPVGHPTENCVC